MTIFHRISDFFFPRICPVCGGRLSLAEEQVCLECLLNLPRTNYINTPTDNEVKNLFELQIPIERAVAFMRYMPGKDSTRLILAIKYKRGKSLALMLGRMMAEEFSEANSDFFEGIDVILPTPLTAKRLRDRGYNQSEMIARGIAEVTGISVDAKSVKRLRFSESQTRLSREERRENVKDAFECVMPEDLDGKHILLIDDIVTTGSTILAVANSILKTTKDVTFSVLTVGVTGEMRM